MENGGESYDNNESDRDIPDNEWWWCKLTENEDLPSLESIDPDQALGYLHQSLYALISVTTTIEAERVVEEDQDQGNSHDHNLHHTHQDHDHEDRHDNHHLHHPHHHHHNHHLHDHEINEENGDDTSEESSEPQPKQLKPSHHRRSTGAGGDSFKNRFGVLHLEAQMAAGKIQKILTEETNKSREDVDDLTELGGRQLKDDSDISHSKDIDSKMGICKRFWSKIAPDITIWDYLQRIHKYCPNSTAVYLTSATYIYRLSVILQIIPVTKLCVHRLVLAALRVASKSLEDVTYLQKRFATVGGVSTADLNRLEIAFLFLLDFDIKVDNRIMKECLFFISRSHLVVGQTQQQQTDDEINN